MKPRGTTAGAALLAVLLPLSAATADVRLDPAAVAAVYSALERYCDEVAVVDQRLPATHRRCFAATGGYKDHEVIDNSWRNQRIWWGDAAREFFWSGHDTRGVRGVKTIHYAERAARKAAQGGRPEGLFARVLDLFLPGVGNEGEGLRRLAAFEARAALDAPGLRGYEHRAVNRLSGTIVASRVWLRESDGLVARSEEAWNGEVVRSAALKSVRTDPPYVEADFTYTAPFFDRYSLAVRPAAFVGMLALASVLAGFLPWLIADARTVRVPGAVLPPRSSRRAWKAYVVALVAAAALLGLSALGAAGGGGHPPPIVYVWILAMYAGLGFLALGGFLAGRQLARPAAQRLFRPTSP